MQKTAEGKIDFAKVALLRKTWKALKKKAGRMSRHTEPHEWLQRAFWGVYLGEMQEVWDFLDEPEGKIPCRLTINEKDAYSPLTWVRKLDGRPELAKE